MARSRPQMTNIDYVVIALSPALIMMLVGSLCFFLLEVFYRGQYESRLTWIMFWFVLGTVLIARISMEEGAERASIYGLALAGAVALAMMRFVDSPFIAWGLMALVWWCANKLTWDCTLIDDSQDASGEGLLQIAGLDESEAAKEPQGKDQATLESAEEQTPDGKRRKKKEELVECLLEDPEDRRRRPHAPGLWVVYFSLAALPLFGLGQASVPASDLGRRRYVFWLLMAYVASGLGLLLTTSFLGLRRYLRQRKLEMPLTMTGAWLSVGAALIVALLLATLLIPRPSPEYPVEELIAGAARFAHARRLATCHAERQSGRRAGAAQRSTDRPVAAAPRRSAWTARRCPARPIFSGAILAGAAAARRQSIFEQPAIRRTTVGGTSFLITESAVFRATPRSIGPEPARRQPAEFQSAEFQPARSRRQPKLRKANKARPRRRRINNGNRVRDSKGGRVKTGRDKTIRAKHPTSDKGTRRRIKTRLKARIVRRTR